MKTRPKTVTIAGRPVLRLTGRRSRLGPLVILHAHADGSPVLKEHAAGWRRIATVCGVQFSGPRGTVLIQWRGFGTP